MRYKKIIWFVQYLIMTIKIYAFHPIKFFRKIYSLLMCKKNINAYRKIEYDTAVSNDLVSVVIPIYDRTQELKESIDSILNQTYQNIELLLVCDGSPDETIKVVEDYRSNPKVRIFRYYNNSGNAVRGRNKAIKEARGQYLAFQDSDDIAEKNRIERSLTYIQKCGVDIVYGGWRALTDGSREVNIKNGQEVFSPDCDYAMLKQVCVPCQSTVMARIDALRDVGGLKAKMKYREDHELWLRLARFGYKFKAIPEILCNLRLHKNNLELQFKREDKYWKNLALKEHTQKCRLVPKIGYLIAGCGISGGLSVVCTHANQLLQRGYDVTLICTGKIIQIDWYPEQMVEIIPIDKVIDNYDILIATYWLTAYTLQKMNAKTKIYFIQSDEREFYELDTKERELVENTYKMEFQWMTMAKWIAHRLEKEFGKTAVVIRNGIDLDKMYVTDPIEPKGDKLRVLVEGSSTIKLKGVWKAFYVLKDMNCEVWYVNSGDHPPLQEWEFDRYFEKVPYDKMNKIYSSCDILLKLSEVESFCLPALEIMACGGIPIVAEVNGIEEFLTDGENGYIVQQGDLETPKRIIQNLQNDKDLLVRLKSNALATAQLWGWEQSIDCLERILMNR